MTVVAHEAPRPSPEAMYRTAVAVAVGGVAILLVLLTTVSSRATEEQLVQFSLVFAASASAASTSYRARRSLGPRRRAWSIMTAGLLLGIFGNVWIAAAEVASAPPAAAVLGDLAFLLAIVAGMAALLSFPTVPRLGSESVRMILDGVVVGGSVLFVMSIVVFPEVLAAGGQVFVRQVFALVIPFFDVVLATLAVLVIVRASRPDRPALALFGSGLLLYSIADLVFAAQSAQGSFALGAVSDVGWVAGYALVALAALHPIAEVPSDEDPQNDGSSVAGTVVVFAVFLGAAIFELAYAGTGRTTTVLAVVVWLMTILAVAARQVLLIIDNEHFTRDLEDRVRRRTADLSEITEQRELLLRSVGDGIYGVDAGGRVTFLNPAAERALGRTADEVVGQLAHDAFHATDDDGRHHSGGGCYVTEVIRSGVGSVAGADQYRGPHNLAFPVEVTASPLTSEKGVQGAVVVFRDVTERREVDRMKDEFISVVSHELRTPLTSIRGALGLVAGGALGEIPPQALRLIDVASTSSERLSRLINDILDFERIDSGAPMVLADHEAAVLVDEALDQMRVVAAEATVSLVRTGAEGRVRADADRVVQTLINLISNAIKYAPRRSAVKIGALEEGDMVVFSVSDGGRGIPPDRLESIFGRFQQVDASDARDAGGTGLGLAICRSIVEKLGGRIWVESEPGTGADFKFTVPRSSQRSGARSPSSS